jgi:integrase
MTRLRLPYIHEYRDKDGRLRRYVRRRGLPRVRLPGLPGSPEFMAAYQAAIAGAAPEKRAHAGAGTMKALVIDYYRSAAFANLRPNSRRVYRIALDAVVRDHGHRYATELTTDKAAKVIEAVGASHPAMGNLVHSALRALMVYAVKMKLRPDNPITGIARYKTGTHHTWTEEELTTFEKRWPLGTRERLAYALLLYTGQRGGDVVRMRRSDIVNGAINVTQEKTGAELKIAIHPALGRAIKSGPALGIYLIGEDRTGRPITRASLTRLMKRAARLAGLPVRCVPHGLRKAILRRLAEHGASAKQIAAVSGHETLREIERYTRAADQAALSRSAIGRLPDEEGT